MAEIICLMIGAGFGGLIIAVFAGSREVVDLNYVHVIMSRKNEEIKMLKKKIETLEGGMNCGCKGIED